jgi:hypothetical protein
MQNRASISGVYPSFDQLVSLIEESVLSYQKQPLFSTVLALNQFSAHLMGGVSEYFSLLVFCLAFLPVVEIETLKSK